MDFERYLDYIGEAILVFDNSFDVVSFNAMFKKLFPGIRKTAYVMPFLDSCPALRQLVAEGLERCEVKIGERQYAALISSVFDGKGETVIAHSCVLYDVTYYETMLNALAENNRLLAKSNEEVEIKRRELENQTRLKERIAARSETGVVLGDLHDTLGHSLTVLNALNRLALLEKKPPESGADELEETLRLAKISLAELDTMDVLTIGGGEKTMDITTFLYRLKQTMLSVSLNVRLSFKGKETTRHRGLFYPVTRSVQEAVTNCLRHSGAAEFFVAVVFEPELIRLGMEDNGTSLRNETVLKMGNGLIGMVQRIHKYGGEIEISVNDGGGMALQITLPK